VMFLTIIGVHALIVVEMLQRVVKIASRQAVWLLECVCIIARKWSVLCQRVLWTEKAHKQN